jgi:thiol:disulfide interchange protein
LDVSAANAKDEAAKFVETHQPPMVDSLQKWNEAFALAKKTNRRVWVRISARYCGPCFLLNRWLDEHREVLEKEFVMLKIDNVRDENGQEVTDELTGGHLVGVPFFAFYAADEKMLVDSLGPTGNIGCISGYESKRHFRKMLEKVRQVLTTEDVDKIVSSLED